MGDPEAPQTLAAGELVWAKTKGRPHWCPARLPAACPASSKDAPVACFGDDPSAAARATRLRRFADPDADKMARDAAARGFLSAVDMAHAAAVALLCTGLTCACASPASPPPAGSTAPEDAAVVVSGVANLSPSEFLASLRRAALDPAVGLVDRARLKSWTRALAQGWGPAGAGRYPRRSVEELVDKIDLDDLNEPAAGEEVDAAAADEDSDKALEEKPLKTPAQKRRKGRPRKDASLPKEDPDDAGDRDPDQEEDEKGDQKEDHSGGSPETALSTGRKRKKSKYLSPPYTNLSTIVLEDKKAGSPKEGPPSTAAKVEKKKVPRDNVDAREVLELVRSFGDGSFCEYDFPKPEERFLGLFRSSRFAVGVDIATLVSDSGAALKLGKSVLERSRKKDEAGIAGASSVKRNKKMDKTSPTATLDFPAENVDFPMENAVATDGADVAGLVSPDSSAAMTKGKGVKKRAAKMDQDGTSVKRKKVEKTSPKATPTLPAENTNTSADGIGLVPHSCAILEEGKGVTKRGRKKKDQDGSATPEEGKGVSKRGGKKKDQDGSGGPSVKRKMMKKTSPTAIPDSGLVITPAVPIRQVRGEDMLNQMKSGAGAGIVVGILDHNKLDQGDGGSVVKTPVTVEATLPETDVNVESAIADLPAKSVQAEETKPAMGIQVDMNVQSGILDVPISGAQMETMELETSIPAGTNEQVVGTDLPVTSGLFPNKHGSTSEPADGNTDAASVEVRTAQDSYASLEAMVPEIYKKVDDEIATGMDVTAMGHAFIADGRKGDQTSQKTTASEAIANHAPAVSTNGACSDTNSTPKRRTKKAPQSFANPAEILLEFHGGAILPSKEELLLEFSKFGVLIEPLCGMLEDIHGARVVFGKSAEAEAVYSNGAKPGAFGQFGPPFANMKRLNYLPQYMPSIPPPAPAPKLPLGVADMRKNVENMISSLAGKKAAAATSSSAGASPVPENLLGEMQRLLLKLDSMQGGPSSGSAGAPPL